MKHLGRFNINQNPDSKTIKLTDLEIGLNNLHEHILKKNENGIEWVCNKICDHAGGKLIVKENKAICPLHGWELNLDTLTYANGTVKKKESFAINDGKIIIQNNHNYISNPFRVAKNSEFKFRWLNHASIWLSYEGITLVTDPWLFGPAFLTGWWLQEESTTDSLDLLKEADYIYISHNHPDHLHPETLSILPKDKQFIVGNFQTKSTEKYLRNLGFKNINVFDFKDIYSLTENFQLSVLKSGDFRDDSGIYLCLGGIEILMTVDCNYLNSNELPQNIDLLFTSFAGGASGFPLCFENYTENEKNKILNRNSRAMVSSVMNYINQTKPRYYHPYAGMFKEQAPRDNEISNKNFKVSLERYKDLLHDRNTSLITPNTNISYRITKNQNKELFIEEEIITSKKLPKEKIAKYISSYKSDFIYDADRLIEYFKNSRFKGKQIIQIIPVNDDFTKMTGDIVYADFYNKVFDKINAEEIIHQKDDFRVMEIKIRAEIIAAVVEHMLPWEDFSIGFQARISRHPNTYEAEFWFHFTNVYVNEINYRYSPLCGACTTIDQNPELIF